MTLVIIACLIFVLQTLLSFMQIRYYRQHMQQTARQYAGSAGYYLYSAMARKRFGASAIAVIIVDSNHIIQACQVLHGKSIFAKFKSLPQFQNQNLAQMMQQFAREQAIRKLSLWEDALLKTANQVTSLSDA